MRNRTYYLIYIVWINQAQQDTVIINIIIIINAVTLRNPNNLADSPILIRILHKRRF